MHPFGGAQCFLMVTLRHASEVANRPLLAEVGQSTNLIAFLVNLVNFAGKVGQ